MKLKIALPKFRASSSVLRELSFILFFCNPFIIHVVQRVFFVVGLSQIGRPIALALIYFPAFIALLPTFKRLPMDFVGLLGGLVLVFLISYAIHPEYQFWYFRNFYGVFDYVLRPDNGLYAYFFIRLINNPAKIMKCLRKSAWIMYAYYAFILLEALIRGYWVTTDYLGNTVQLSYDLSYGYNVLFFLLIFLYAAMKERRLVDIVMSGVGFIMIILGGSRGPLMCIMVFVVLYFLSMSRGKKRIRNAVIVAVAGICLFAFWNLIFSFLSTIIRSLGLSSRTLDMLIEGSISDDNGRSVIWAAAIDMIRRQPLGYGAMGTRHVIYYIHDVGHCHQFFLEVLVDFGVILGGALIIFLLWRAAKILLMNTEFEWKALFLIFFSRACQLMLSGTYWHVTSFWGCIGIGAAIYFDRKRKAKLKWRLRGQKTS